MLNPDDPNVRMAQFGRQVELFLESDVGSFLVDKASKEMDQATKELQFVDPFNSQEIIKLQNRIKVAKTIIEWLGDTIKEGLEAMEELKNAQN